MAPLLNIAFNLKLHRYTKVATDTAALVAAAEAREAEARSEVVALRSGQNTPRDTVPPLPPRSGHSTPRDGPSSGRPPPSPPRLPADLSRASDPGAGGAGAGGGSAQTTPRGGKKTSFPIMSKMMGWSKPKSGTTTPSGGTTPR